MTHTHRSSSGYAVLDLFLRRVWEVTRRPTWLPLLAALMGPAALAQEIERSEKIEVTGSRIKRVDTETPAPVQVITRGDIEKSGKETVADVIRNIPADNNGSISLGFGTGFAAGGSAVSLRGLSSGSTLVLINGRRTAPYGLADDLVYDFVNLNTIPLDAVERIEVLKDGASAIYGSDAIAGVVNVILRSDYQGATVRGSWGTTRYNDGDSARISLTAGKGDIAKDGYSLFVNVEAAKQEAIWQKDRAGRAWIGDGDVRQWGYGLTGGTTLFHLGGWFRPATGPTVQVSGANPFGLVRNPANLQYVQLPGCNSPYALSPGLGGCLQSLSDWRAVLPQDKSVSVFARGVFQPGASLHAYLEGSVFRDTVKYVGQPSGVAGLWADSQLTIHNNQTISLGPNHPDNPFGATARFRYQTADVGPVRIDQETTVSRTVAGLKGSAWAWDFDSAFFYAESKTNTSRYGFLRNSVLLSLLDGSSPLGYYRLGINAHLNSPELYAALSPTLESESKTSVTSWDLKASRDLMRLRGGPLALAVGAEVRKEKLDNPPIPFTPQGDITGWGYWEHHLERRVVSAYGELAAPVLANVEVAAALRTDRYSDYGRSTTPKLGVRWTPMRELLVRGTYSEGFRAPGAAESGKSASSWSDLFRDPVRCPVTSDPADCGTGTERLVGVNVGSPDVKPQESKSYTAGFVIEPVRNASLSIDYWQIKRKNDFTYVSTNYVLENLALFPQMTVIRDNNDLPGIANSGTVLGIVGPYLNFGRTQTSGFDVDAKYRFDSGPYGRASVELLWTYLREFKKTFPDGNYTVEYAGTHGPTGLTSNAGTPRNRGTLTLTWENGPWTVSSATNYVSGVKNVEFKDDPVGCLNQFADGSDAPDGCYVGGFTTTSLFGRYRWTKELEVFGSIQNLFDRIAPLDPQTYGALRYNVAFHLSGAIGRQYSIGARYTFR